MKYLSHYFLHKYYLIPEVKLKLLNTLFALTIANFYIFSDHPLKLVPHGWLSKLYDFELGITNSKTRLELFQPFHLHKSPPGFSLYRCFLSYQELPYGFSALPLLLLGDRASHFPFLSPSIDAVIPRLDTKMALEDGIDFPSPIDPPPLGEPPSIFSTHSSDLSQKNFDIISLEQKKKANDVERVKKRMLYVANKSEEGANIVLIINQLKEGFDSVPTIKQRNKEDNFDFSFLPPLRIDDRQSLVKKKITPTPDTLPPFDTYKVNSKNFLITFWLMKIAPGAKAYVAPAEIPYRRALIETILEMQDSIGSGWEEDNDEHTKLKRLEFHNTYMTKSFKVSDLHLVDPFEYCDAYDLPGKLGVRAYRTEDIDIH